MHRGIRFKKMTTKRSKTTPSVAAATLAQAFKVNFQFFYHTDFIPYLYYSFTVHRLHVTFRLHEAGPAYIWQLF